MAAASTAKILNVMLRAEAALGLLGSLVAALVVVVMSADVPDSEGHVWWGAVVFVPMVSFGALLPWRAAVQLQRGKRKLAFVYSLLLFFALPIGPMLSIVQLIMLAQVKPMASGANKQKPEAQARIEVPKSQWQKLMDERPRRRIPARRK